VRRGQGIGSAILKELLGRAGSSDIMLTTIGSRMRFYEKEGFQRLSLKEVPRSSPLQFYAIKCYFKISFEILFVRSWGCASN